MEKKKSRGRKKTKSYLWSKGLIKKTWAWQEETGHPLYVLSLRIGRSPSYISQGLNDLRHFSSNNLMTQKLAEVVGYSGPLFREAKS